MTATEVLLGCLRPGPAPDVDQRLARYGPEEWTALVDAAIWHGVAPLLQVRLGLSERPKPSGPASSQLRDLHALCVLHNTAIRQQLRDLQAQAESTGTQVAALKGAYLAHCAYEHPGARAMSDIDLLVPPAQVSAFQGHLERIGYSPAQDPDEVEDYHLPELQKAGLFPVELHRDLAPDHAVFQTDIEGLWGRVASTQVDGFSLSHPASDDVLLHVCVHTAFNHEFKLGVRGACDIDALIRGQASGLDWARLVQTANSDGRARYVYAALRLAEKLLESPVPTDVLRALEHSTADDVIVEEAVSFVLSTEEAVPAAMLDFRDAQSVGERARALWRGVFPPVEELRRIYSIETRGPATALFYAVRPFDLVLRRGRVVLGLLAGTERQRAISEKDERRERIRGWARGEQGRR